MRGLCRRFLWFELFGCGVDHSDCVVSEVDVLGTEVSQFGYSKACSAEHGNSRRGCDALIRYEISRGQVVTDTPVGSAN